MNTQNNAAFALDDPTISINQFTLGDLFTISALFLFCTFPLIWCYFKRRSPPQSPTKHPQLSQISQILDKLHVLRAKKCDQYDDEYDDEYEYEYDDEDAKLDMEVMEHKENEILPLSLSEHAYKFNIEKPDINMKKYRRESVSGPIKGSSRFAPFVTTLIIMIISGSSNDFLGKLIYQMYPGNDKLDAVSALKHEYWLTFLLTFGSFFVCFFALFAKTARSSFVKLNTKLFIKIAVPSIMDTLVTGGRYLGLVFLSAALISILKNGSQLLFLALLRRCFHHKKLLCAEWFGIVIIIIGLLVVALNKMYIALSDDGTGTFKESIIGIIIMVSVGFAGAIRNDIEELLLKNDNLDANFIVGLESAISLTFTMILGVILYVVDPFDNIDKENMFFNIKRDILINPAFIICFVLFLVAIYAKDTMQMKMTALSSSLTRKLFQQIYPPGTWLISLIAFAITSTFFEFGDKYGEAWEFKYSWIRLAGFVIVLVGNYFYIKGHFIFAKLTYWRSYTVSYV